MAGWSREHSNSRTRQRDLVGGLCHPVDVPDRFPWHRATPELIADSLKVCQGRRRGQENDHVRGTGQHRHSPSQPVASTAFIGLVEFVGFLGLVGFPTRVLPAGRLLGQTQQRLVRLSEDGYIGCAEDFERGRSDGMSLFRRDWVCWVRQYTTPLTSDRRSCVFLRPVGCTSQSQPRIGAGSSW